MNEFVGADSHRNGANKEASKGLHHLMHCFNYLCQTTSCEADTTLEGSSLESTAGDLDIDEHGVKDSCKDRVHLPGKSEMCCLLTISRQLYEDS